MIKARPRTSDEPAIDEPVIDNATMDEAKIERIALAMLDLTLPLEEWGHEAHFAAALWLLRHPEILAALGGMEPILRRYNKAAGVPDIPTRGYHDTITKASMSAAAFMLNKHASGTPLEAVLASLLAAEFGNPDWLLTYWSKDLLMSLEARRSWSAPDIAPFPYEI